MSDPIHILLKANDKDEVGYSIDLGASHSLDYDVINICVHYGWLTYEMEYIWPSDIEPKQHRVIYKLTPRGKFIRDKMKATQ